MSDVEFYVSPDLKDPGLYKSARYLVRDAAVFAARRLSKTVTPIYVHRKEGYEIRAIAMADKGRAVWLVFCTYCGGPGHIGCEACKDTGFHKGDPCG